MWVEVQITQSVVPLSVTVSLVADTLSDPSRALLVKKPGLCLVNLQAKLIKLGMINDGK
jgi:hypothetical protein